VLGTTNDGVNNVTGGGVDIVKSSPISTEVVDGIKISKGVKYASAGTLKSENVTSVVLHWTAGWKFHADPTTSVGYQFTVDSDGTLWETNPIKNKSSHAGCPSSKKGRCHGMNSKSVGISYVGGIKYHQKLGVEGVHNFPNNKQDNDIHGYAFTEKEWLLDELYIPYNQRNGKARTIKVNPKNMWDSIVNAILLAKAAHPTITNITSHHWTSADKQDIQDGFPWGKLIGDLKAKGFSEVRLVKDWPSQNIDKGQNVYQKKVNLPENLFGPQAQEQEGNK
jgi:N-acetyl-anhydromuramyl-L-alanine amidase AmpD